MPFTITEFESTPNPNAVKCWLDRPISEGPRSFLNAQMAQGDPRTVGHEIACRSALLTDP